MKRKSALFVVLSVVLCLLTFTMPVMANASPSADPKPQLPEQTQQRLQQIQENGKKYDQIINTLQPYLHRNTDGTLYLQVPPSVVAKLDVEPYKGIQKGLDLTNQLIKNGTLSTDNNCNIIVKSTGTNVMPLTTGGVDQVVWYWWGFYLYLSHATVYTITTFETALLAISPRLIPDPRIATAVATILAADILLLRLYDGPSGTGVKLRFNYTGTGADCTGIWSQ